MSSFAEGTTDSISKISVNDDNSHRLLSRHLQLMFSSKESPENVQIKEETELSSEYPRSDPVDELEENSVEDVAKDLKDVSDPMNESKILSFKIEDCIKMSPSPSPNGRLLANTDCNMCTHGTLFPSNVKSDNSNRRSRCKIEHYQIFVGDLSPELGTAHLYEAFSHIGEIFDCRVVRDPDTLMSKCYGFVSFVRQEDAETALATMNGQLLGSRPIRTNWAIRRAPANIFQNECVSSYFLDSCAFDKIFYQSSPQYTTVYCGGIAEGLTEYLMLKEFSVFGAILEVRTFEEKGYAFIRFGTKEAATHAIVATHNTQINGQTVRCYWGREGTYPNNQQQGTNFFAAYPNPKKRRFI